MIRGKETEVISLKSLAEELKQGVSETDENYLVEELADLDKTVAVISKGCANYQQKLEEGLKCSNDFNAELQKTTVNVNKKKQELEEISQAHLAISSVKAELDELNVNPIVDVYNSLFYIRCVDFSDIT